jgi:hypothetical protein
VSPVPNPDAVGRSLPWPRGEPPPAYSSDAFCVAVSVSEGGSWVWALLARGDQVGGEDELPALGTTVTVPTCKERAPALDLCFSLERRPCQVLTALNALERPRVLPMSLSWSTQVNEQNSKSGSC